MRIPPPRSDRGIALIIVMLVIIVLSVLAGGFAYSMKVETKLARNTSYESDMEWLGRSGVELGKYALAMQMSAPPPDNMYFSLQQPWAGGPPNPTNEAVNVQLKDVELGNGKINVTIQDLERKYNISAINEANPGVLERALMMVGADSGDIPTIIDSYFDWIDNDGKKTHLAGAENPDYLAMFPPYYAKNGPIDDIRELLLIKGMNEQIFWGTTRVGEKLDRPGKGGGPPPMRRSMSPYLQQMPQPSGVGLVDLFVPFHGAGAMININTASAEVMELIQGIDPSLANGIVSARNDAPFHTPAEGLMAAGADPVMVNVLAPAFTVRSRVFEITVDAEIGTYKRRFVSLVDCRSARDVITLTFTWK